MPPEKERPEVEAFRKRILNRLLYIFALLGLPAACIGVAQTYAQGRWMYSLIYAGIYICFLLGVVASRKRPYRTRALFLVSSLFLIAFAILMRIGMSGVGLQLMLGVCFMTALFFGMRAAMLVLLVSLAVIIYVAFGMITGIIEIYPEQMLTSRSSLAWITGIFVFFMMVGITVSAPEMLRRRIEESLDLLQEQKGELETANQQLQQEILSRRQTEEALRESEERFSKAFRTNPGPMTISEIETGRFIDANEQTLRMLAFTREEMIGRTSYDLGIWDNPEDRTRMKTQLHSTGSFREYPVCFITKTQNTLDVLWSAEIITLGSKKVLLSLFFDITDRKRVEDENRKLRSYLENVINSMPSLLVGVDKDGNVTQWNAAAEIATGVGAKEALGQPIGRLLPMMSLDIEKLGNAMGARMVEKATKLPRMVAGEIRYDDVIIYPLVTNGVDGAVIRVDDVTERVLIEEMMIQSEKMASVGGLAAGMAHEINNPLGVILQASQNVLRRVSPDLPANIRAAEACGTSLQAIRAYLEQREILLFLEDIRQSGHRAAEIVGNMLNFSRKTEGLGNPADVAELLDRTVSLAASDYDLKKRYDFRQIEIVREYEAGLPKIICQESKIQQVFLNILRNGAEAMSEGNTMKRPPRFILRIEKDNAMVRVVIEDNGPGMDEGTRKRVFEPFFTTKPPGSGTGLGLSISYFIITEDHRGTMSVESSPGNGARFIIGLPMKDAVR